MISDALVNHANEVRTSFVIAGYRQNEFALGISLSVGGFLHARGQFDQDDFVPGGRFVGRSIRDRAGERGCIRAGGKQQNSKSKCERMY